MNNALNISNKLTLLFLALFTLTFTACDDDEGVMMNDQELITTVRLTFTAGGSDLTFSVADPDGDGGNAPVIDEVKLAENTEYVVKVEFLDESDPADVEDITLEVAEENLDHLVCYTGTGVPVPTGLNTDSSGDLLGLTGLYTTTGAATGSLRVVLKHLPDKAAADACATGETDVEVTFPVVVE